MFDPKYVITNSIANSLIKIESNRQLLSNISINKNLLQKETLICRIKIAHLSTQIEGNQLSFQEAQDNILKSASVPFKEDDELDFKYYYQALEKIFDTKPSIEFFNETIISELHHIALKGKDNPEESIPYRDDQNIIFDKLTGKIAYMPPEKNDVPILMNKYIEWIVESFKSKVPCSIIAGIVHYQFITILPYFYGNWQTARLLTLLILHGGGLALNGLCVLEEEYVRDLDRYYSSLSLQEKTRNYYTGQTEHEYTNWLEYFCDILAQSLETSYHRLTTHFHFTSELKEQLLRKLDPKQKKALLLFRQNPYITSHDIQDMFSLSSRSARMLCKNWVDDQFLKITDISNKSRKYTLEKDYELLV